VITNLPPPRVFRVAVKTDGAPVKGKVDAPVTIVEFTDFHCPFCKRVLPTLDELESRYGDKIRIVFRDFPIDSLHPEARKGHEAARCAGEQGKFWPFHDKIFANAPKVSADDLKAYAKQVNLDVEAFERCFTSGKYRTAVEKDIDEGKSIGVTGTPSFIINGRTITGARSLDFFKQVIDEELANSTSAAR
jgi:protein-disulfide isomerase